MKVSGIISIVIMVIYLLFMLMVAISMVGQQSSGETMGWEAVPAMLALILPPLLIGILVGRSTTGGD